jgi:hypothetical protein
MSNGLVIVLKSAALKPIRTSEEKHSTVGENYTSVSNYRFTPTRT